MSTISVHTAQNVEIEYPVATILDRILGYLLDLLFLGMVYIPYTIVMALIVELLPVEGKEYIVMVLFVVPFMLYDLIWEIFYNGQTFGKIVMSTKVISIQGTQPSLGSYLLRWMFRLLDITVSQGSVAVITILFNGKGQRLGDLAGGTTVIKLQKKASLEDTILLDLDEHYSMTYSQTKKLDETAIALVREVLQFVESNKKSKAADSILEQTKEKIAVKMGVKPAEDAITFLSTVLRDYNFLHQQ